MERNPPSQMILIIRWAKEYPTIIEKEKKRKKKAAAQRLQPILQILNFPHSAMIPDRPLYMFQVFIPIIIIKQNFIREKKKPRINNIIPFPAEHLTHRHI
jgi:hypothetical protein